MYLVGQDEAGIRVVGTDRVWPSQQPDHGNRAATESV
jgi:hypothetical protein